MTVDEAIDELARIRDAFRHDIPDQIESQEALTLAINMLGAAAAGLVQQLAEYEPTAHDLIAYNTQKYRD